MEEEDIISTSQRQQNETDKSVPPTSRRGSDIATEITGLNLRHSVKTSVPNVPKAYYKCVAGTSVLYEGTKVLWKSRNRFDIFFVSHFINMSNETWEIVAYNSSISIEAERIYVKYTELLKRIDKKVIESKVLAEKELYIRQKKSLQDFHLVGATEGSARTLAIEYVLARLILMPTADWNFTIQLRENDDTVMTENGQNSMICSKPKDLQPLVIKYYKNSSVASFHDALHQFQREWNLLHLSNECATIALTATNDVGHLISQKENEAIKIAEKAAKHRSLLYRWAKSINVLNAKNLISKLRTRLALEEEARKKARSKDAPLRRSMNARIKPHPTLVQNEIGSDMQKASGQLRNSISSSLQVVVHSSNNTSIPVNTPTTSTGSSSDLTVASTALGRMRGLSARPSSRRNSVLRNSGSEPTSSLVGLGSTRSSFSSSNPAIPNNTTNSTSTSSKATGRRFSMSRPVNEGSDTNVGDAAVSAAADAVAAAMLPFTSRRTIASRPNSSNIYQTSQSFGDSSKVTKLGSNLQPHFNWGSSRVHPTAPTDEERMNLYESLRL
eukprot:CAMPEP_0170114636 /NCGR_PEP_ID=MMETSP0020_2-20130122/10859_1 /TAXON_ID=98059 /ORGANISM="Dinobryon sp., Strain UTEXLB2267" /LENGTH=555 /DNA_ID=CAMNT_0010341735 /DNA_START=29 /DNA_END=1696 /DNA_ORIENTATION=-